MLLYSLIGLVSTTCWYTAMSLLPISQPKKKKPEETKSKKFVWKLTTSKGGPVKSAETKQGWKHKKTILLQENHDEERLLLESDTVICKRYRVVFQSSLSTIFCSRVIFLCFHPHVSVLFTGPCLCVVNFLSSLFLPMVFLLVPWVFQPLASWMLCNSSAQVHWYKFHFSVAFGLQVVRAFTSLKWMEKL